jgi:hypothetical protein
LCSGGTSTQKPNMVRRISNLYAGLSGSSLRTPLSQFQITSVRDSTGGGNRRKVSRGRPRPLRNWPVSTEARQLRRTSHHILVLSAGIGVKSSAHIGVRDRLHQFADFRFQARVLAPFHNVLSEQELETASGGAFDTYRPAADSSSPILYSGIGGGKAGLPTKD